MEEATAAVNDANAAVEAAKGETRRVRLKAEALDAKLRSVPEPLKAGDEVRLVGFGSFTPVERKAGMARNPRTGAAVKRPASKTARFRVGDSLKSELN